MKHTLLFLALFTPFSLVFLSCAAPCTDPEVVKIPAADATAPVLHWEVAVLTQTPAGPISSYTPYNAASNSISVHGTDQVDIYLVGRDEESGIKKIGMSGGFTYTCTPGAGTPFIADGIIPNDETIFNKLTTCGLKEWKIAHKNLNVAFSCGGGAAISNRSVGLTGKADNFLGGHSETQLIITVTN